MCLKWFELARTSCVFPTVNQSNKILNAVSADPKETSKNYVPNANNS